MKILLPPIPLHQSSRRLFHREVRFKIRMTSRASKTFLQKFKNVIGIRNEQQLIKLDKAKSPFMNPYDYHIMSHGPGTKDNPNNIPSAYNSRIVGCICDENSMDINFMELNKGDPKRCECGFWFKLISSPKK